MRTWLNVKPCSSIGKNKAWSQLAKKHCLPGSSHKKTDQKEKLEHKGFMWDM